jgi:hypothetical protein
MALTDSDKRLKRTPDNDRDIMRAKAERVLVADVNQSVLNLSKAAGFKDYDLDTIRTITDNPTLTQHELDAIKAGTITEPTGKFKKDK